MRCSISHRVAALGRTHAGEPREAEEYSREDTTQSYWNCGRAVCGRRDLSCRPGSGTASGDRCDHRCGAGSGRTGSRRVGHRRDQGPSDQLHQDRRHQRSGPIPAPGAAERELQRVGPRIRPRRFQAADAQAERDAGDAARRRPAKTPQEAAKVYPGDYWLSMLEPPAPSMFPGTGPQGNGVGAAMQSQSHWINSLKSDCNFCHQLGNQLTRSVDHVFKAKPELKTHAEAWEWRLGTGVRGNSMYGVLTNQGPSSALKVYSDWTERIAKGEVPATTAAASERDRAQPRAHAVGRRRRPLVHARPVLDGQESPDGERERADLRRLRRARLARRARSEDELDRRDRDSHSRASRRGAVTLPAAESSRRCGGATRISGPTRRTTRPIRTTRCSTARAACG